jgi:hypothetical protein
MMVSHRFSSEGDGFLGESMFCFACLNLSSTCLVLVTASFTFACS